MGPLFFVCMDFREKKEEEATWRVFKVDIGANALE
jgi:hypothetical protein